MNFPETLAYLRQQLLSIAGVTEANLFRTIQLPVTGIHEADEEYEAATVYTVTGGEAFIDWEERSVRVQINISIRDKLDASEKDLDGRAEAAFILLDDDEHVIDITPITDVFLTEENLVSRDFTITMT